MLVVAVGYDGVRVKTKPIRLLLRNCLLRTFDFWNIESLNLGKVSHACKPVNQYEFMPSPAGGFGNISLLWPHIQSQCGPQNKAAFSTRGFPSYFRLPAAFSSCAADLKNFINIKLFAIRGRNREVLDQLMIFLAQLYSFRLSVCLPQCTKIL